MATETADQGLTDRQQEVLRLTREGKNPTEVGRELGISSQGVHGHLRKLRQRGLIEGEPTTSTAKPRPARRGAAPRNGTPFDPAATIDAVRQAIAQQREALDAREAEIDSEIATLRDEKQAIAAARKELDKLTPEPAA